MDKNTQNQGLITNAKNDMEQLRLSRMQATKIGETNLESKKSRNILIYVVLFLAVTGYAFLAPSNTLFFPTLYLVLFVLFSLEVSKKFKLSEDSYKTQFIKTLTNSLFPQLEYSFDSSYYNQKITDAKIIFGGIEINGFYKGKIVAGNSFDFAIVKEYSFRRSDFSGLIFRFESPLVFCEEIIIRKGFVSSLPLYLAESKIIDLEGLYPEFEAEYQVFSKNEAEAKRILSYAFLRPIFELSKKWDADFRWSFIGHQICFALEPNDGSAPNKKLKKTELKYEFNDYVNDNFKIEEGDKLVEKFHAGLTSCIDVIDTINTQLGSLSTDVIDFYKSSKTEKNTLDDDILYDHLIDNSES